MPGFKRHLYIPDAQVRPGVRTQHLPAISNYIEAKRPDVIVCLGDFADLPSLSSHSLALEKEGKRYRDDIESAKTAMAQLTAFRAKAKNYNPRMHMTLGNHEHRINRAVADNPALYGALSIDDLEYERFGWKVHPFLKVIKIDGVESSHYFVSGPMGRPVSSAAAMLRERQSSCIQGHVQKFDLAVHPKTRKTAIMAGVGYLHDEVFLSPQGNDCRRQIVVLNEVKDGRFDMMFVSMDFLLRQYT